MSNKSIDADMLMKEHEGIRASLKHLKELADQQFETAERSMTDRLSPDQIHSLEDGLFDAGQNMVYLEGALRNHYTNEANFVKPLLGSLLRKAVNKETDSILGQFARSKSAIGKIDFKDPDRERAMTRLAKVRQSVDSLAQQIEAHSTKLDGVLELAENVLGSGIKP